MVFFLILFCMAAAALRINLLDKKRERLLYAFPVVFLFAFSAGAFYPGVLFAGNITEFELSFESVLPILLFGVIALLACCLTVYLVLPETGRNVLLAVLFGISIAAYLQYNFLNADYGLLTGQTIDWSRFRTEGIASSAAWGCLLAASLIFVLWKKDFALRCMRLVSGCLALVLAITLVTAGVLAPRPTKKGTFSLTYDGAYTVSKNENIIVFVLDCFDGSYFSQLLEEEPQYAELFPGFVFYDNAISMCASTPIAIPMLLSGNRYLVNQDQANYWATTYDHTPLYDDLEENGYDMRILTVPHFLSQDVGSRLGNAVFESNVITSYTEFGELLYQLALFNAVPQFMKEQFWMYSGDFAQYISLKGYEGNTHDISSQHDYNFYQKLIQDGIQLQNDNAFRFYHFCGCHLPYIVNENMELLPGNEQSTWMQQLKGTLKIVEAFLNGMKELGVYQNATVILTGDHGAVDVQQNPAVLVKRSGEDQGFSVSSAPITFEEVHATMGTAIKGSKSDYGRAVWDVPEDEERSRVHVYLRWLMDTMHPDFPWGITENDSYMFVFHGDARDMSKAECIEHPPEADKALSSQNR